MIKLVEVVGQISVPDAAMRHRFAVEALGCATLLAECDSDGERVRSEPVVGTGNIGAAELYGWAPNVESHVDNTGLVYLVALNDGDTVLSTPYNSLPLLKGTVVRLNDFVKHWTADSAPRVCAFVGSYPTPCDEWAVSELQAAVDALARGGYYGAPRVSSGFRAYLDDECLVGDLDTCNVTAHLLADAMAKGLPIERCALCDRPAITLDRHWPYDTAYHRCNQHRKD